MFSMEGWCLVLEILHDGLERNVPTLATKKIVFFWGAVLALLDSNPADLFIRISGLEIFAQGLIAHGGTRRPMQSRLCLTTTGIS
jgi:hypothetical protein